MAVRVPEHDSPGRPGVPARLAYVCACDPLTIVTVEAGWQQDVLRCPFCADLLVPPPPPVIPSKF